MTVGRVETVGPARTPDAAYDAAVTRAVAALAAVVGICLVSLAPAAWVLTDATARAPLGGGLAAGGLVALGAALAVRRYPLPDHVGQPVSAGLLLLAHAGAVTAMVLTEQPRLTSAVLLVVVAAGAVLLSLRWLGATLYLVWGGWALGAFMVGPSPAWPPHVAALAGGTLLALGVNHLRRADVRRLAAAHTAADASAVRDQLTGLANRRGLAMVGGQMVEQARRQGDAVHCLFVDVDGLKKVNEAMGNEVGDEVLVAVAEALRAATRGTDVVARWGGDEFCVVGPGPGMAPLEMERRVREGVVLTAAMPGELLPVRVSAGGAMLAPWDSGTLETLLGKADQEMYLRRSLRAEAGGLPRRRSTAADSPQPTEPGS